MHNIMRCDGLFKAILLGNVVAVASLTTYNQDSFVVVFGSEVLHRRVRQNDLFRIDLLIRGNCVILVVPFLFHHWGVPWHRPTHWFGEPFLPRSHHHRWLTKQTGRFFICVSFFFLCFYLKYYLFEELSPFNILSALIKTKWLTFVSF